MGATLTQLRDLGAGGRHVPLDAELAAINARFAGPIDTGIDPFRKWALARHLDAYARVQARSLDDRPWRAVATEIAQFCKGLEPHLAMARVIDEDMIRRFAVQATAKSQQAFFYSSLVLFLADRFEVQRPVLEAMLPWLPTSERNMISDIVRQRLMPVVEGREPADLAAEANLRRVNMGFAYHEDERQTLETFFDSFKSPTDGFAHFVGYRSGHNSVDALIKSFLVIFPPRDRDYFTFSHFYRVPSRGQQERVSRGFVLPLKQGLYLVGGQRQANDKGYTAFMALDVIALDWNDLNVHETLFCGLALTSNYDQAQITGRIAFRATPIAHSGGFPNKIDRVPISKLVADVAADLAAERALPPKCFMDAPPEEQAADILAMTNNAPEHWIVSPGFEPTDAEKDRDVGRLDRAWVEFTLTRQFGSRDNPRFASPDGNPFEFWSDVRFGMLAHDR